MENDNFCFCCGARNPHGLHLDIQEDGQGVSAVFTVPAYLQGFRDVVHGGVVSTLLDELMAHAVNRAIGGHAATVQMEVSFRRPAPTGQPLKIVGEVERVNGRRIHARGSILDADGQALARAKALFLKVSPENP